jgi:NTE family protein
MNGFENAVGARTPAEGSVGDELRLARCLADHDILKQEVPAESQPTRRSTAGSPLGRPNRNFQTQPAPVVTPIRRLVTSIDRPSTAFVLSGGGSLGAVQVGMLRALLEANIRPDFVVGTSIGALNAAFLVGHMNLRGIGAMERLWCSIHRRDVFRISPLHLVRGTFGSQNHLFSQLGLQSLIVQAGIGFSRLEDAPVPVHVVTTDLFSGDPVVLSKGDAMEALMASAAIPGVFPPVRIGTRTLIDGGVVANLPVRQAIELGATRIFVLPAIFGEVSSVPSSALDMMQHATMIATAALARSELQQARQSGQIHILPLPDYAAPSMFDFDETSALIESAYVSSASWLRDQTGKAHLRGLPSVNKNPGRASSQRGRSILDHPSSGESRDGWSRLPQPVA